MSFLGFASPIVNQTNAGVTSLVAQIASGGGGGGGGGPDLALSTLTMNSGIPSFIQLNNGDATRANASLVFPVDSADTSRTQILMEQNSSTLSITTGLGFGALQLNTLILNSQLQNPQNLSTCVLQTSQFGDFEVSIPAGASMNLFNRNINCSTINGVAPSFVDIAGISTNQVFAPDGVLNLFGDGGTYIDIAADTSNIFIVAGGNNGDVNVNGRFRALTVTSHSIAGNLAVSSITTDSILLGNFQVPKFQNGRFVMPNANSNVVETDIVFSDTSWGAWAGYDGAVQSAVSSIGTEVLSRSTFAVYAQGGLGISWQVLGN
jgi:hypothetical protein